MIEIRDKPRLFRIVPIGSSDQSLLSIGYVIELNCVYVWKWEIITMNSFVSGLYSVANSQATI